MKKVLLLLSFLTLLSAIGGLQTTFAQVTQEWVATYINPNNLPAGVKDMVIDTNGNIYITGGLNTPAEQNGNFLTIKYNTSGIQQWAVQYNGPGSNSWDVGLAIAVDKAGNVYVTGKSEQTGWGTDAYCTIKYNSNGIQQWVARYKYYPGGADDPAAIAVDDSGNVYVTGTSYSPTSLNDYLTIKYNLNGDSVWVRRFNGDGNADDRCNSLFLDKNGNIYVTGFTNGGIPPRNHATTIKYNAAGDLQWVTVSGGNPYSSGVKITMDTLTNDIYVCGGIGGSTSDYLTIKYNSDGVQQWLRNYDGSAHGDDIPFDLKVDNIHNIYVTGQAFFGINGSEDYTTIKYNSNGDSLWVRRFNLSGNDDYAYSIALDKYNNVYVTGASLDANNNYNFATVKYNTNGVQQWVMTYPGGGASIKVDKYLNVYVTGGGTSPTDIKTIKYSQPDAIRKISNEIPVSYQLYQNYPNPFNPSTKIKFDIPGFPLLKGARGMSVRMTIYDLLGREVTVLVNQPLQPGTYEVDWNAADYPSGVYFYRLTAENFSNTKKMVLLK